MADREQNGHSTAGEEFDRFLKQDRAGEEKSSQQNSQGFLTRLKKDKEFRDRIIHTAIVCWSFITLVNYN